MRMQQINKLLELQELITLINESRVLVLAAAEELLDQLPKGNWIGGTIPYFMDDDGGLMSKEKVFVTDITNHSSKYHIKNYDSSAITDITKDRSNNGYSFILVPGFSNVLARFAVMSQNLDNIFDVPLVGWVTGIDLVDVGKKTAKVYNGQTGFKSDNEIVITHVELEETKIAELEILNIFSQGDGDEFEFLEEGFSCTDCLINGEKQNLAEYITRNNIDTRLPIVADYSGAKINISFQQVDEEKKKVLFYAPLRKNEKYKLANPVENYVKDFINILPKELDDVAFSCNCILNYLYSELEGKKTGKMNGPFTFGEIAYVLVNQTMVYVRIVDK